MVGQCCGFGHNMAVKIFHGEENKSIRTQRPLLLINDHFRKNGYDWLGNFRGQPLDFKTESAFPDLS
jgi:hypothetical protein